MSTPASAFRLDSWSLCSKWGFNDGDFPMDLDEWIGQNAPDLEARYRDVIEVWQRTLVGLVKTRLLPALAGAGHVVETDEFVLDCTHNPIRASRIDGVEIDDYAIEQQVVLRPEYVEVPYAEVADLIRVDLASSRP